MERIKTPSRWVDKFAPPAGVGRDGFRDGDPPTGTISTKLEADWFDQIQEEIARAVEGSGLNLDPNNMSQLWEAIQRESGRYVLKTGDEMSGILTMLRPGNASVIHYIQPLHHWSLGAETDGAFRVSSVTDGVGRFAITPAGETEVSVRLRVGQAGLFLGPSLTPANPNAPSLTFEAGVELVYSGQLLIHRNSTGQTIFYANGQNGEFFILGACNALAYNTHPLEAADVYMRGLDDVLRLAPVTDGERVGMDVEGLEATIPECVKRSPNEAIGIDDKPIVYAMVNAIKELATRLAALEGARR